MDEGFRKGGRGGVVARERPGKEEMDSHREGGGGGGGGVGCVFIECRGGEVGQ